MKLWQLVLREIGHRKLNFALSLLAVVLAVACAVGVVKLLDAQEQHTRQNIAALEKQTQQRVAELEEQTTQQVAQAEKDAQQRVAALDDEIRKITKNLGFNIYILPKDQNLAEFHSLDFAAKTMPQSYVNRLAESRDVVTVQHLRPALIRKMKWTEQNRQIVLMGISGIVPFLHRDQKKPLTLPVPEGKMNVGAVLADELSLKKGQTIELLGEKFKIDTIFPPRGNIDDITAFIDLGIAQRLLDMQGQINMIQALECNCATIDRLGEIEQEITGILGSEVKVIETSTTAIARAKARNEVKKSGELTVASVKASGEAQLAAVKAKGEEELAAATTNGQARIDQWQRFAAILIPTVIVAAGFWIALLSLANVRQRRTEIGIWRAIGFRSRRILAMFLSKAFLIGLIGAVVGSIAGAIAAGAVIANSTMFESVRAAGGDSSGEAGLFVIVALLTPSLAVAASWLPAVSAANQDPAVVLREE
jgi:ABC-type lipoprotein release transport system permease subunit/vacuolar-type H+-ATPase subunit H